MFREVKELETRVAGHEVHYKGQHTLAFRTNGEGILVAFCGKGTDRITVDGRNTVFADRPMPTAAWAPIAQERRVKGGAFLEMFFQGQGQMRIPVSGVAKRVTMVAQGAIPGSRGEDVPCTMAEGCLLFEVTPALSNRWLYASRK